MLLRPSQIRPEFKKAFGAFNTFGPFGDSGLSRLYAKPSRAQRIEETNYQAQRLLIHLDTTFGIYNKSITLVVDLGYAPGNWLAYSQQRLAQLHQLDPAHIYQKCTLVGLDLLFGSPPPGTYSTQGNIFSRSAHQNVAGILKLASIKRLLAGPELQDSPQIQRQIGDLISHQHYDTAQLLLRHVLGPGAVPDHRPQLVTSDLAAPFLQSKGFFNNTESKPYIRTSTNEMLRQPYTNPEKSSIDMAEAALLFCLETLAENGSFIVRLARVDLADPELLLLQSRLQMVFHNVDRWAVSGVISSRKLKIQDLFFVCRDKRDTHIDKYTLFA